MDMVAKRILVVEDEKKIMDVLESYLEKEGFFVFKSFSGKDALEAFKSNQPHLIILDLMLPDLSGEEVCKKIRKNSNCPIIMLTAKTQDENIIEGLNMGADDYMTKPFSPKQLIARVNALLRRTVDNKVPEREILEFNNDDLIIDNSQYQVIKSSINVNLTPNEYKILYTMAKHPKKTFTRGELITIALGDDFDGYDRTVDVHIKNLRQKIEEDPKEPKYILTVHGVGYRFGGEKNEV